MTDNQAHETLQIVTGNHCESRLCSSGSLVWDLARSVQQALEKLPPAIREQYLIFMEDSMHSLTAVLGSSVGLKPDRALEMFANIMNHLNNLGAHMDRLAGESETPPPGYVTPGNN